MLPSLCSLAVALAQLVAVSPPHTTGYLVPVSARSGVSCAVPPLPYVPREGDLVFYDDHNPLWLVLFIMARAGEPTHMGIVVKKIDGALGVLEAGPDDKIFVTLKDVGPRLHQFRRDYAGTITIRRCKTALAPKQSAALTRFAQAQVGKPYDVLGFLMQGTPMRVRGLLEPFLGATALDRDAWICSELAVAAGTVAGLFDRRTVHANVAYPEDLVDNHRHNLGAVWHDPAIWRPGPPPGVLGRVDSPAPGAVRHDRDYRK
jgi:hypothetical protein